MPRPDLPPVLRPPDGGGPVTRNEIMDVMADEGYSADSRKAWLKEVLTHAAQIQARDPDAEREALIVEIKQILRGQVDDAPDSD